MSETVRRRARKGEGERLRAEILEAADRLLVETGDEEAVSVRAIAREVGVAPPSIYLHFPDKRGLLHAVCERHFADLDAATVAAASTGADEIEALREAGRAYVAWGVENPEPYRIIFMTRRADAPPFRVDEPTAGAAAFRHALEAVERAMASGHLATDEPLLVATGWWALLHGVTSLVISTPGFPAVGLDRLLDHALDAWLAGVAGPAAQRTSSTR